MLIYHPAYDAFHCIFRSILIADSIASLEITKLRILDFFLTFPAEVRSIRFQPGQGSKKKLANQMVNIYHGPVNRSQTFRDMEQIQLTALRALAASSLIYQDRLAAGIVERTDVPIPYAVAERVKIWHERASKVENFILDELANLPLHGVDGLKDRTGLMEFRYDAS